MLNIAFENPRKIRVQVDGNLGGIKKKKKKLNALQNDRPIEGQVSERYEPDYLVPDRSAGLCELEELRRLCPGRRWNFVSFPTDTLINCLDSGISGRDQCTVCGISSCSTGCKINYVAWPDRDGLGQCCDGTINLPLIDVHLGRVLRWHCILQPVVLGK